MDTVKRRLIRPHNFDCLQGFSHGSDHVSRVGSGRVGSSLVGSGQGETRWTTRDVTKRPDPTRSRKVEHPPAIQKKCQPKGATHTVASTYSLLLVYYIGDYLDR